MNYSFEIKGLFLLNGAWVDREIEPFAGSFFKVLVGVEREEL